MVVENKIRTTVYVDPVEYEALLKLLASNNGGRANFSEWVGQKIYEALSDAEANGKLAKNTRDRGEIH